MKTKLVVSFLIMLISFAVSAVDVIGNVPLDRNSNVGILPKNSLNFPEVYISRDQYLISYNKNRRLLNWAAWKIDQADLGHVGRTNNFEVDSDLEAYLNQFSMHAVTPEDYQGSCYDRGHQVPSADRDNSVQNNQMTFLMSNMIPQTAYLNRDVWEHLEQYARDLVNSQRKKIYIVAGPIFDQDFGKIGKNHDIPVPSKDFKVLFILNQNQSASDINSTTPRVAVIIPNILKSGKRPIDDLNELCSNRSISSRRSTPNTPINDWEKYVTSLDEIERLSGFKFQFSK